MELENDDTLFSYDVPRRNLAILIQQWRMHLYRDPAPSYCIVNGCGRNIAIHGKYFFLCQKHHHKHMGYLTRLYKNAEKSIARTLIGYARTRPPDSHPNNSWLYPGDIRSIENLGNGNTPLFNDYLQYLRASFLNMRAILLEGAWENFAGNFIYPMIIEMMRKAYFYRYIAVLSTVSDDGHMSIVNTYARFLEAHGDTIYDPLRDNDYTEWQKLYHIQDYASHISPINMCDYCDKKEAVYHDPVTLGEYCSNDCRLEYILCNKWAWCATSTNKCIIFERSTCNNGRIWWWVFRLDWRIIISPNL